MRKNAFFVQVPRTHNSPEWENIINRIPEAETVDGMKFLERVVLSTNVPNRKNRRGETQNIARAAGTGDRDETLVGSFERGIDVREMPPKLIKDGNNLYLYGGYGRANIFDQLGYKFWIYDIYQYDPSTRNHLQSNDLDVLEDAAISDNGAVKCKPASKGDYVGILVKRHKEQGWGIDQMKEWFNTIEHCLTKKQIIEYVREAQRSVNREGRLESFGITSIKQIADNHNSDAVIINSTDAQTNYQRVDRSIWSGMSYMIRTGKPMPIYLHNSKACSHQEIDDSNKYVIQRIEERIQLMIDWVDYIRYKKIDWKSEDSIHVIYQKIGGEHKVGDVVKLSDSFR